MITYHLEEATTDYILYNYYPWKDINDKGYIKFDRKGNLLEKQLTKADSRYPIYYNEMLSIAARNSTEVNPQIDGSKCWL